MSERINGAIAVPVAAAQMSFPAWFSLDHSADVATKIIPIFGALAGALYAINLLITVVRNWRAARAERLAQEAAHGDA